MRPIEPEVLPPSHSRRSEAVAARLDRQQRDKAIGILVECSIIGATAFLAILMVLRILAHAGV